MEIDIETLTACEIAADGGAISLGFIDSAGRPATVTLSLNDAGSLAMTLPGLITRALRTRFGGACAQGGVPVNQSRAKALLISLKIAAGVMAGLVPAIHVFLVSLQLRRGCPGQARA